MANAVPCTVLLDGRRVNGCLVLADGGGWP